jgi:5-oxoprolinase (ATP-hydrolysing)
LIQEFSLSVVQAYMEFVQKNAETAVRTMLKKISHTRGMSEVDSVTACDRMDDGSVIQLKLTIDRRDGSAEFDFTGTAPESFGMSERE